MPLPGSERTAKRFSAGQRGESTGTVSRVGSYDDDLRFAHVLADAADDITTKRFKALDLRVETKPDLTPVSDADRAAEDSIRNILRRSRPRDAVLGEESGQTGSGPRRWVIDPIDATKNYVRGVPVWATLIGLMDGDKVVAGVVSAPGPRPALVGGDRRRRLDRQVTVQRLPLPRLRRQQAVRRVVLLLGRRRLGRDGQAGRVPVADAGRSGGPAGSATSGRTCWSPRAPSTSPPSPTSRSGTWRRSR